MTTAHSVPPAAGIAAIPQSFWNRFRPGRRPLLMLDYDGTLAPFRDKRDEATPHEGVRPLLVRLMHASRLVIVTGRPVRDLLPLLSLEPNPEVFGSHGWERLRAGCHVPEVFDPGHEVRHALDRAADWIQRAGHAPRSEQKAASVTIHWRAEHPMEATRIKAEARAAWEPLLVEGTELHAFNGGMEIRATGRTKGDAVRTLLREAGPGTPAAFLGDDLTDEDGFAEMPGENLAVLVHEEWRDTRARFWLRPPGDLVLFLERWLESCSGGKEDPI